MGHVLHFHFYFIGGSGCPDQTMFIKPNRLKFLGFFLIFKILFGYIIDTGSCTLKMWVWMQQMGKK